jgi:succinate-semialdehyde dehydrogenase
MTEYIFKQLINGEWVDAANGKTWNLLNPATEESLGEIPFGNAADAAAAIDAAHKAFPAWASKTPYERAEVLLTAAEWIKQHHDDLARLTTEECGKPLREARAEWQAAINLLVWYAEEGKRVYGRTIPARIQGRRIMVIYQPIGVVGTISAWNFPVYNHIRQWAAALAAGCTVVGRPSEYTPRSAMLTAQALHEAGAPAGVVNLVSGEPDPIGKALLKDPRCRKISFTGSTRVGKILMDGASQTVTKLALELGGNAPVIIFPDMKNVEATAKAAAQWKYRNAGQVCISPQRFYVHSQIAEEFIEHAAQVTKTMKLGSGLEKTTDVGPLINKAQREKVESLVSDAVSNGAQVLTGGSRPAEMPRGYFYSPTVLANIAPNMRLHNEEIFGPVLPVVPFSDADEALALANATEYGLSAYVHTNDLETAVYMYEKLEYGMVAVNDWFPSTAEAPFGGMKQSGIGRECGKEGIEKFLETKTVYIGGLRG